MRIRHLPRLCQTFTDNVGRRRRAVCHRLYTRYTATLTIGTDTNCLLPQRMKARGVPNTSMHPRFATAVTIVSGQGTVMVSFYQSHFPDQGRGRAALNILRCFRSGTNRPQSLDNNYSPDKQVGGWGTGGQGCSKADGIISILSI
jgi:hypothetical protein